MAVKAGWHPALSLLSPNSIRFIRVGPCFTSFMISEEFQFQIFGRR
jgi:hypothetical protein